MNSRSTQLSQRLLLRKDLIFIYLLQPTIIFLRGDVQMLAKAIVMNCE